LILFNDEVTLTNVNDKPKIIDYLLFSTETETNYQ